MRGDILFWPASPTFSDTIITKVTNGPFVHCAVDMGDGTEISAHSEDGVNRRPLTAPGLTRVGSAGIETEAGIVWLQRQVGTKYDYGMCLNAFLRRVGIPWRVYMVNRYDCSVLVAHYLEHVGIDLSDDDEALSPNDIARALGVLKK